MGAKKLGAKLRDRENCLFALWFLWMAVYYGVRMFALTPWYDELYTYYYFISRGPVYAAIHWPLPNNHVGYSVLSAFLDWFGNPYIGLRGVSYLCALANLVLLYKVGKRHLSRGWSFACVALYSCMNLVNQLAVQGRGYTLAACCCLAAIRMLQQIGLGQEKGWRAERKYYIIFSLSLTLGLYVLPSSVYWVLPICIIGGLFLLLCRKTKKLLRLIAVSVAAALHTVVLYGVIWLAIGSNLLSKAEGGAYYGRGHVSIILSAPFQAMKTGIDYMLASPYIQSVEREGYAAAFAVWIRSLLDYFYSGRGLLLMAVIAVGLIGTVAAGIHAYRQACRQEQVFLSVLLAGMMVFTPVILAVQCKLPYFRVFSYMGIPLALLLTAMLQALAVFGREAWRKRAETYRIGSRKGIERFFVNAKDGKLKILAAVFGFFSLALLLSGDYNNEYGMTEYYAKDALEHAAVEERATLCVTDCYQQYLLKFCFGIACGNMQIEGSDLVLIHREMEQPEANRWEFYQSYDSVPWEYINGMEPLYENKEYIVYVK